MRLIFIPERQQIIGVIFVLVGTGASATSLYMTMSGLSRVKDRAALVGSLPVKTVLGGSQSRVVKLGTSAQAICNTECLKYLLTGAVSSYVISYVPARTQEELYDLTGFREFRKGQGEECRKQDAITTKIAHLRWAALYHDRGDCVIGRDLEEAPDGIWVSVSQFSKFDSEPFDFRFKGSFTQISVREDGRDTLLVHSESGTGHYLSFPPRFLTGWGANSGVQTAWVESQYRYGKQADWRKLLEQVSGIPIVLNNFSDRTVPRLVESFARFGRDYANYGVKEKQKIFLSMAPVLRQKPDLFERFRPLVERGIDDVPIVSKAAFLSLHPYGGRANVPLILSYLGREELHQNILVKLKYVRPALSSEILLKVTETIVTRKSNDTKPGNELFQMLYRHKKNDAAALRYMLRDGGIRYQRSAACKLLWEKREALIKPLAGDLLRSLEIGEWSYPKPGRCDLDTVLVKVGYRSEAVQTIRKRLTDTALSSTTRAVLEAMQARL
jgi:hypothetical protein